MIQIYDDGRSKTVQNIDSKDKRNNPNRITAVIKTFVINKFSDNNPDRMEESRIILQLYNCKQDTHIAHIIKCTKTNLNMLP